MQVVPPVNPTYKICQFQFLPSSHQHAVKEESFSCKLRLNLREYMVANELPLVLQEKSLVRHFVKDMTQYSGVTWRWYAETNQEKLSTENVLEVTTNIGCDYNKI